MNPTKPGVGGPKKNKLPALEEEELVSLWLKQTGKTKRFMGKLEKFNDYEARIHNQQVIDYMIKGNKKEPLIPKSGEFFLLRSKEYDDPSVALKIPINELFDNTKTWSDLHSKYAKKPSANAQTEADDQHTDPSCYGCGKSIDPAEEEDQHNPAHKQHKYEAKLTTNLKEISGVQLSKYLVPSSVLFSDVKEITSAKAADDTVSVSRPISAQVAIDRAKMLKASSTKKLLPDPSAVGTLSELEVIDSVSRYKVDVRTIKKNSYQIKRKGPILTVPTGYNAQKLVDPDQAEDERRLLAKTSSNKFSPFLGAPMEPQQEFGDIFDAQQRKSNNLFSLEYFMFPEHEERDEVGKMWNKFKEEGADGRVFGYTKQYNSKGEPSWTRVEVLEYEEKEERFTIKWIDRFVTKKVTRSNFYFERENSKEYFKMLTNAVKWREMCCTYMRYLAIIDKMDSPTNGIPDKVKDKIAFLVMGKGYELLPPRDPILRESMKTRLIYDCGSILRQPRQLSYPSSYNIIEDFAAKKYDLKYFNKLNEEVDLEFVRANHRVELDSSLPYSEELQKIFKGYLDNEVFLPVHQRKNIPSKYDGTLVPLSADKRELKGFLSTFATLKAKLHQASPVRLTCLNRLSQFMLQTSQARFCETTFPERRAGDVDTFISDLMGFAHHLFFDQIGNLTFEANSIIDGLRDTARYANEEIVASIKQALLSGNWAAVKKPADEVRYQDISSKVPTLKRLMDLINFKIEFTIKGALRAAVESYNLSFKYLLERFERMVKGAQQGLDYANLTYQQVLEYQNNMQYQQHSPNCPLVLVKLSVSGSRIVTDKSVDTLKQFCTNFLLENIEKCAEIRCLESEYVGVSRPTKLLKILETESGFLEQKKQENQQIITNVFTIFEVFFKKVKEFEFLFDEKQDRKAFRDLKKQILLIKSAKEQKEVVFFKDKLQTGLFLVDCTEIKAKLDEQIRHVVANLIDMLIDRISTENDRLAQEINTIENKLLGEAENVYELEAARSYAQNIDSVLKEIMEKIKDIMGKMDLVEALQYHIPYEQFKTAWKSYEFPARVKDRARRCLSKLDRKERELTIQLRAQQDALDTEISKIAVEFEMATGYDNLEEADEGSKRFSELFERLTNARKEAAEIQEAERITNQQKITDYAGLHELIKQFNPFYKFWEYASNLKYKYLAKLEYPLDEIVKTEFTVEINEAWNDLFRMEKSEFKAYPSMLTISKKLRAKYGDLKPYIPLVADLKNESLKGRHWADIRNILKLTEDLNDIPKVTFRKFLNHGALECRDQIKDVSEIASKENSFVRMLNQLRTEWKQYNFETQEFRDTKKYILKGIDPITDKLDEDIAKLSAVLSSPFVKFLEGDISSERNVLIQNQEIIDVWVRVQKHWQYLQPIFSSEDIIKQRPTEAMKFGSIENMFITIMENTRQNPCVPEACKQQKIFENLTYCLESAESIIKSLNDYLNEKRQAFPRFYFLPNEGLLTILAQTRDVKMIQKFLNKCFEGIETLTFNQENLITEFKSIMQESLAFTTIIDPFESPGVPRNVEEWLKEVEKGMKLTLKDYFKRALESFSGANKHKWLFQWPSQIVSLVGQTLWTSEVEAALANTAQDPDSMKQAYTFQRNKLMDIVALIQQGDFSARDTITLEVLIILEVHNQDVIEELQKNKIVSKEYFEWTSQLRYYWGYNEKEKSHRLSSRMVITEREYGWEYLGNQGRLVITPLTDRCYRTLMSALQMNLGGAPEGPAGTGKTETTKDLAKALAKHCVVFNCSDELEIEQMSKFFMGLASCGSWACFDEFNRIEVEVLSVIAQQILQIQTAILMDSESKVPIRQFSFDGGIINLDPTCAIFITMNPGYQGRSELPDNLKRLFRSIAMMIPNYSMIAEISLYSYGYQNARSLSTKIVQCLKLSSEQLSTQSHYDFGMRSLKTILIAAGNLKRQFGGDKEEPLIIRAISDCTFPKFTSEDIPLFDNIVSDLFPAEKRMTFDYGHIEIGINKAAQHFHLVLEDSFRAKIIQLYETIRVRHGLMIVGEPFSGKSSILHTLRTGWEFGDRIKGIKHRIELEARNRAIDKREKKTAKAAHLSTKQMAESLLKRKNTEMLEKETPATAHKYDESDPEYFALYQEYYKELIDQISVADLMQIRQGVEIVIDPINPKAINSSLLYGIVDESSGDWKEGIAAKIFKECSDDETDRLRWIVFDGPVDALWIESMNTVLDDNKKLCLANSDVIKLTSKMSIVFEVEDLAEASLATVSRCGMVYLEARQMNKRNLFENWYKKLPASYQSKDHYVYYDLLYTQIIETAFEIAKGPSITTISHYSEHHLLINVLRYFQGLIFKNRSTVDIQGEIEAELEKQRLIEEEAKLMGGAESTELPPVVKRAAEFGKNEKSEFLAAMIFAVIWGVGSSIDTFSRDFFEKLLGSELKTIFMSSFRGLQETCYPPDPNRDSKESWFDIYYNMETKVWSPFSGMLGALKIPPETKFNEIFIPTKDSVRISYITKVMIKQEFPFLLFGKTGTGKTQVFKKVIMDELDQKRYIPLMSVLSANTKQYQLQELLESKLEKQKRAKGIYGPLMGTKNIIFVDDLNMPNKETFGAQPPLELIRQALDLQGWYDRKTLELKKIVDIQFLAAMGLGRPDIPKRLNRHFTTLHLFEMEDETVTYVFRCILDHGFNNYPEKIKILSGKLVNMVTRIYKGVCKDLRPLPGKSHYLFNLRDISKIIQGLLSIAESDIIGANVNLQSKFAKLLTYESKRVFSDRFVDQKDRQTFENLMRPIITEVLGQPWDQLVPPGQYYSFGNFIDQSGITKPYKEITSLEPYKASINGYIQDFNERNKRKINILLFEECLENLAKLNRVLSREHGHALQVGLGGDGRRTLTRLAVFMQDYDLKEMDAQKDVLMGDWQEFLREVFRYSGVKNKPCAILATDAQLSKEGFYEDINNLLNIGEIPNLFKPDDKEAIITDVKVVMAKNGKRNASNMQAWEYFLNSCKSLMHFVLCASPIGDSLRLRLRNFPSLVNCSNIMWYLPWTSDSLKVIGADILEDIQEGRELISGNENKLVDVFVTMHQIVNEETKIYERQMGKHYYITPLNYNELLSNFTKELGKKQKELLTEKQRYEQGVKKLDECSNFVEETRRFLAELAPQLKEKSKQAEITSRRVEEESIEIEEKKRLVSKEEQAAAAKQQIALEIKQQCNEKLSGAVPILQNAQKQVASLDKSYLVEIKSLKEPPMKAVIILEGVLRLFGHNPKRNQDSAKFFKDAVKKELHNVEDFLHRLKTFNVETVSETVINGLKNYIQNQKLFNESTAEDASLAFKILYNWVMALINYYDTYQSILPLREDLKNAEASLEEANQRKAEKEAELKVVEDKFEAVREELEKIRNDQNELSRSMRENEQKLHRSIELNDKLSGERSRWENQVERYTKEITNIIGDIVLACGSLSYMGPFTLDFRRKIIMERWIPELNKKEIPNSGEKFSLQNVLGNPIDIQEWSLNGLPQDATSVENVLIMKRYKEKFPLVIDPQGQFLKFIRSLERPRNPNNPTGMFDKHNPAPYQVLVLKASLSQKELEMKLWMAIPKGDIVVVEAVGEHVSGVFDDLLSGNYVYSAGMKTVKVGSQVVEVDKRFRLYLVSNLTTPHYTPELQSKVVYLDFSITPTGLNQQMVSLVCRTEEPKDEEDKMTITRESFEFLQKQKEAELRILKLLSDSRGNVVENDALLNSLNESKATSEDIKKKLKQSAKTEEKIEKNQQNYRPLAALVCNIFLVVKDLYKLDPMYQFSLKWFESVVVKAILSTEKAPGPKNPEKRVADLKSSILKATYQQICKSVFVKHKQLLSFLLAITLWKTEDKLDLDGWNLMLTEKGTLSKKMLAPVIQLIEAVLPEEKSSPVEEVAEVEDDEAMQDAPPSPEPSESPGVSQRQVFDLNKPPEPPKQISNVLWRKVEEASKHEQYFQLKNYVCANPEAFLEFIDQMDQRELFQTESWTVQELIAPFSTFSALIFIKLFRPDLFPTYAKEFVRETLGQYFTEEVIVPIEKSYEESNPLTPFIYILAPGDDPQEEIKKFAQEKATRVTPISLGRGQGAKAEETINECCRTQSWVLLQNCHLAISWLPNLERIIEEMSSDKAQKPVDPNFRLFLTAVSTTEFPISILQNGIKLTKDPPKGVKASLQQIYMNQNSTKQEKKFFNDVNEQKVYDWRSLFMSLSYFHAVIRERRRYGPVGWNIPYDFNESDFKISIRQLKFILNTNPAEIPFKALIYLTSECFYGGKVTDNQDRRLLKVLLEKFYCPEVLKGEYYFSENRDYFIPQEATTLEEAIEFVNQLPDVNEPQVYGLNTNASISSAINDTTAMIESILSINPNGGGSGAARADSNSELKSTLQSMLNNLPENFDIVEVKTKHPIGYDKCMNTVLIQEVLRYNTLLSAIKSSIQDLVAALEGTIVMTAGLEEMADRVNKNQVPSQWTKRSYPSLKPMASYFEDLLLRIKMFKTWVEVGQPKVYWVPGFFFTQSFFSGVLQEYARIHGISIDELEFRHHVMPLTFAEKDCKPEGCYTSGLFMESARWDFERQCLAESVPKRVFFEMPTIYFEPYKSESAAAGEGVSGRQTYECPLYKTTARRGTLSTTGHSTNYILSIQLESETEAAHWVTRGVALVTQLNE